LISPSLHPAHGSGLKSWRSLDCRDMTFRERDGWSQYALMPLLVR
jgi:hypothetical protein